MNVLKKLITQESINAYTNRFKKMNEVKFSEEGNNLFIEKLVANAEQIDNLRAFQKRHGAETDGALERLRKAALTGGNIFAELMEAVRVASLGQITHALYEVGGQYRRAM